MADIIYETIESRTQATELIPYGYAVNLDGNAKASDGGACSGVIPYLYDCKEGSYATIIPIGSQAKVKLSANVSAGNELTPSATGWRIATTGDIVGAIALENGLIGEYKKAFLVQYIYNSGKLSAVTTDTTLTGDGTALSPLSVVFPVVSYSATEIDTGKKWIDTGAIYQIVVDFGALPNTTTKAVAHSITTIDTLISVIGIAENTTSHDRILIPNGGDATGNESIQVIVDNTNINVTSYVDYSGYDSCYVILEYTKV